MIPRRIALGLVAALALVASGCLTPGKDDESLTPLRTPSLTPKYTDRTGAVAGVITTLAIEPVLGATVTLLETNATGVSVIDGSYAVSNVKPGKYTLTVVREGYKAVTKPATVRAGEVARVDFTLTPLDDLVPYVVLEEFQGYTSCAFDLIAVSATGGCDSANDKVEYYTTADVELRTLVGEMTWSSDHRLSFTVSEHPDPQGDPTGINKRAYGDATALPGERYLRLHLTTGILNEGQGAEIPLPPPNATYDYGTRTFYRGQFDGELSQAAKTACEPVNPLIEPTGERVPCRTFGAGAALAVPYRIILSTFYVEPAPDDYTALREDST